MESKWNRVLRDMTITSIPFEYSKRISILNKDLVFDIKNKEECQQVIQKLVNENNLDENSFGFIRFEIDFDMRKLKKEVKNKLEYIFKTSFKDKNRD